MERRKKALVAVVVSALSLISMPVLALIAFSTALFQPSTFGILILFLLFLWLGATIAAITYSEEGWTVRGSTPEWIVAAMINPIWTLILYILSRGEENQDTSHGSADVVEYKRSRMRWR
jgi:hypothetical protein